MGGGYCFCTNDLKCDIVQWETLVSDKNHTAEIQGWKVRLTGGCGERGRLQQWVQRLSAWAAQLGSRVPCLCPLMYHTPTPQSHNPQGHGRPLFSLHYHTGRKKTPHCPAFEVTPPPSHPTIQLPRMQLSLTKGTGTQEDRGNGQRGKEGRVLQWRRRVEKGGNQTRIWGWVGSNRIRRYEKGNQSFQHSESPQTITLTTKTSFPYQGYYSVTRTLIIISNKRWRSAQVVTIAFIDYFI